jgi:DNA-binding transcriptional LysR family regulator
MHDFNDLQFFAAVVSHGSFSAGARSLKVPKSRVSRRIALLEKRLGVRLLERNTRRVALTEVGQQVYEHARAVVVEAQAVEEVALRMQSEPRGLVRLSVPLGLERAISEPLPAFLAEYPHVRLQCIVTNRRVDLIDEGIDIAIRVRERLDTDAGLHMRRIGMSQRFLVASPKFLAAHTDLHMPKDLARVPVFGQQEDPGKTSWQFTGPNGEGAAVLVEPRFASGSFELLRTAATGGVGVALLPAAQCQDELTSGALVRVLPDWSVTDGIVHLVFTSRRGMLPGVRAVIEFAVKALRKRA